MYFFKGIYFMGKKQYKTERITLSCFYGICFNQLNLSNKYYGLHFTVNVCNLVKVNRVFILCRYTQHHQQHYE